MFTNPHFEEIFIFNEKTLEIHAASKISPLCNFNKDLNATDSRCTIHPTANSAASFSIFKQVSVDAGSYDFCGHCFPGMSKR